MMCSGPERAFRGVKLWVTLPGRTRRMDWIPQLGPKKPGWSAPPNLSKR